MNSNKFQKTAHVIKSVELLHRVRLLSNNRHRVLSTWEDMILVTRLRRRSALSIHHCGEEMNGVAMSSLVWRYESRCPDDIALNILLIWQLRTFVRFHHQRKYVNYYFHVQHLKHFTVNVENILKGLLIKGNAV